MAAIVFDDWAGGLDLRKSESLAAPNLLRVGTNVYITTGKAIKKRPCLTKIATLEAGTKGLIAAGGKLNTFYGAHGAAITHANSLFRANRVCHPNAAAPAVTAVHYGENFNGYLYCAIEYAGPLTQHHYLDDPGVWAAATAYVVTDFRRPITANGFRYEVTAIAGLGQSGAGEPAWPTTINATVIDNPGPNQVTWTCRSFAVVDTNCPHSKVVRKMQQKIYAADGADVAFCATSLPRDWTAASDAGFIPSGIHASGSDTVTALGDFRSDLAIFYSDSTQVWDVDSDPANNALKSTLNNIGTLHSRSPLTFADDLVFLSKPGFRSLSLAVLTDSLQENDVGSPIDDLRSEISDGANLIQIYYPTLGQLWAINNANVYVFTFSKSAKIKAWSRYSFPIVIDDAAVLNNELYFRNGDEVYRVDRGVYNDDGIVPECLVEMYYQDNKSPGVLKQFLGFDGVVRGTPEIAFKFDPNDTSLVTTYLPIEGDLRVGDRYPMEICATSVAPVFRHEANEDFQIDMLQCYYEELGPV
jgi:hypothetical protein